MSSDPIDKKFLDHIYPTDLLNFPFSWKSHRTQQPSFYITNDGQYITTITIMYDSIFLVCGIKQSSRRTSPGKVYAHKAMNRWPLHTPEPPSTLLSPAEDVASDAVQWSESIRSTLDLDNASERIHATPSSSPNSLLTCFTTAQSIES